MAKQTCMVCGRTQPFDFIMRDEERLRFPDPDKTELEIHIKRSHSIDDIKKTVNPTEFNKRKQLREKMVKENLQEQEGEPAVNTDELLAQLFTKSAGKQSDSGASTSTKSAKRGGSRSKRSASGKSKRSAKKSEPTVLVSSPSTVVKGMAVGNTVKDASSADL